MNISELNEDQQTYLFNMVMRHTGWGMTASRAIALGEMGDMTIEEAFIKADMSKRSAKIWAKKVEEYQPDPNDKLIREISLRLSVGILEATRGLDGKVTLEIFKNIAESLKSNIRMWTGTTNGIIVNKKPDWIFEWVINDTVATIRDIAKQAEVWYQIGPHQDGDRGTKGFYVQGRDIPKLKEWFEKTGQSAEAGFAQEAYDRYLVTSKEHNPT